MPKPRLRNGTSLLSATSILALLLLVACSVDVRKNREGEEKNVDIRTPVGRIQVGEDVDSRDTGLEVYPGARRVSDHNDDDDNDNANVRLSFGDYGLRVVVVHYESDDPSEKVIAFYRDQLKQYGGVLECHSSRKPGDVDLKPDKNSDDRELRCDDQGGGVLELKSGTRQNQRVVAIEAKGKVTSFTLVRAQTHGPEPI